MKYIDFLDKFKNFTVIDIDNIKTAFPDFSSRRLYEWQKSKKIIKIIRGYYVLSDKKLTDNDFCLIANKLREPSYISTEYALQYYSLIPEAVFLRTSVCTKKTLSIESPIGNFNYRSIRENLFFGYIIKGQESSKFKIAEPEKAILDLLYLRSDIKNIEDIASLRINPDVYKEKINNTKLDSYSKIFNSPLLVKKVTLLKKYIKNNA
jgi:predicted transcriptional regulator of viral defense system